MLLYGNSHLTLKTPEPDPSTVKSIKSANLKSDLQKYQGIK